MDAVKFVDGSDDLIEGLAIPFGGPYAGKDLDGEDFGPDTDFAFEWFPQGRPLIYHHGRDKAMKRELQGRQIAHELTDAGVWARAQLDKSAKYHAVVAELVAAGKLYFSSGSLPQVVEVEPGGHIKAWPWVELSMTPTPANTLAAIHPVKAADVLDALAQADLSVPPGLIAAALKALDGPDPDDPIELARELEAAEKAGRVLSDANRKRIAAALASREAVLAAYADLESLLTETDPEAKAEAKAVLELAFHRDVAATLGRAALIDFH